MSRHIPKPQLINHYTTAGAPTITDKNGRKVVHPIFVGKLPAPTKVARTVAEILRNEARNRHGGVPLCRLYLFDSYSSMYWSACLRDYEPETQQAALRLMERYHRFHNYVTEVMPQWSFKKRQSYADNSTERVEYSPVTGAERIVMEVPPHGDACF